MKIRQNIRKQEIAKENARKVKELIKDKVPTITSSHDVRSKRIDNEYAFVPAATKITSKILDKRFEDSDAEDEPEFD
jgi:hypothetical protein